MTGFLTPQDCEDGCCSGESGGSRQCALWVKAYNCSVEWAKMYPRHFTTGIPTQKIFKVRIVKSVSGGATEVIETTEDSGFLNLTSGTDVTITFYICCRDPGYGDCNWELLQSIHISPGNNSCRVSAGCQVFYQEDSADPCGTPGVLLLGASGDRSLGDGCAPPLDLTINGQPPSSISYDGVCSSGGLGLSWCTSGTIEEPVPTSLDRITVRVSDQCGDARFSSCEVPCLYRYSHVVRSIPGIDRGSAWTNPLVGPFYTGPVSQSVSARIAPVGTIFIDRVWCKTPCPALITKKEVPITIDSYTLTEVNQVNAGNGWVYREVVTQEISGGNAKFVSHPFTLPILSAGVCGPYVPYSVGEWLVENAIFDVSYTYSWVSTGTGSQSLPADQHFSGPSTPSTWPIASTGPSSLAVENLLFCDGPTKVYDITLYGFRNATSVLAGTSTIEVLMLS